MDHKPKAVKYKVIAGYLLLFAIAVVSVWFVYTEILKIATPKQTGGDNKKIIKISNTIADLYASEALGRISILTGSTSDHNKYNQLIDSINSEIQSIKTDVEPNQVSKFDSIQLLLTRKKNSVAEIIQYRKDNTQENAVQQSITGIYNVKDSILGTVKPVKTNERYQWRQLVNSLLTPRQMDSLSKLPVSNDSLAMAFDKVLTKLLIRDNALKYQLYRKEQKLLEENRIISDQLRVILATVENEFLQDSYSDITETEDAIKKTIDIMAWVGAGTLLLLIIFAWMIIRDLASNQNYRKQLELLNEENEGLLRSKSMLMATVTHDLQTPLGSIIGFHDLLKNSGVNVKQSQYLENIRESADYILKLVNDLLDFSKLENNRITIETVSFNVKNSIENTCRALEPLAHTKNIELNWDLDEDLNSNFISDPYRIRQVLTNLISNSIKFTREGSVEITARLVNESIYMSVLDTGIGIAREKHGDVFKEFTQAHSGIEKKFGGTGLGLTISKRIIELLDGTLQLESEEGQGSIFTIILPAIPAGDLQPRTAEPLITECHALQGKRILVIDDDNVQLSLMKELLSNYSDNVTTEINSSFVMPLLESEYYDIVLTDIQMPILDGFDLIALIRQHPVRQIAKLPVIALSGKRDLTESDFTSRGFTAHHPKPINMETLLALLCDLTGEETPVAPKATIQSNTNALYSLKSLSQFTYGDPEALKIILTTFIASAYENCEVLQGASAEKDRQKVSDTAHKMIPMLKQMEVHSIANLLMPLEDNVENMEWEEVSMRVHSICRKMAQLIIELEKEIA
ncbi:MAG: response regulator [Flavobacterium sp.]|nr:MAG: response regulator [Flavobacterium sp.]